MELSNKVAIITGAASGIGAAAAGLFAAAGAQVVVADRDLAGATTLADQLGGMAVAVDVADAASVTAMIEAVVARHARIDILVNNAGYGVRGSVVTTEEAEWDRLMAVNLKGVYLCSRSAIPVMAAGGGGVIVNTASVVATVGIPDRAAYVASKGGVAALTRAMALDHAAEGIRVNAVLPGTTWSSYFDDILARHEDPQGFVTALNARAPMNRTARPEEIAEGILWLASGRSSFATGSLLTLDGGMTVW